MEIATSKLTFSESIINLNNKKITVQINRYILSLKLLDYEGTNIQIKNEIHVLIIFFVKCTVILWIISLLTRMNNRTLTIDSKQQ